MTLLVQSVLARGPEDLMAASADVPDGVDLLEVRADVWLDTADALAALLPGLSRPAIVTLRPREQGGHCQKSETERIEFLSRLAPVAAYVDVEHGSRLAGLSFAPARKILSWHDFSGTAEDLPALVQEMHQAVPDADIFKIAVTPTSSADLLRTLHLLASSPDHPLAVMAMGARGVVSRVLAKKLGSALVYTSTPGGESTGPGQIDSRELTQLYRVHRQSPGTRVFAVVGNPLGHSLSPLLHNTGFRIHDLDHVYVPLEVDDLSEALELAEICDIRGFSVTLPFKEDADRIAAADLVGSPALPGLDGVANTLLLRDGLWHSGNTDVVGFLGALRDAAPDLDLASTRCLVLGAGGVARTVVACLRNAGAPVSISARTRSRAEALAADFYATVVEMSAENLAMHSLVVNATPVGMHPHVDESPVPPGTLTAQHIVFDLIYRPRRTLLLRQAEQAGARTIDGLKMFLRQGFAQYREFTGQDAPEAELRRCVADFLENAD